MAPGQVATPHALLTSAQLAGATDVELAHTAAALMAEQHRRALADNDLDALLEDAFVSGFTDAGMPREPWITGGVLVCPGYIRYKSKTSHECSFVSIGGTWVWEHDQLVSDVMRQVPGPKPFKHSVSLVSAQESMEVDVVAAVSKSGGPCQMQKATSYQVRAGELVVVTSRARTPDGHKRA